MHQPYKEEERLTQISFSFCKVEAPSRVNMPSGNNDASQVPLVPRNNDRGSLRTDSPYLNAVQGRSSATICEVILVTV